MDDEARKQEGLTIPLTHTINQYTQQGKESNTPARLVLALFFSPGRRLYEQQQHQQKLAGLRTHADQGQRQDKQEQAIPLPLPLSRSIAYQAQCYPPTRSSTATAAEEGMEKEEAAKTMTSMAPRP